MISVLVGLGTIVLAFYVGRELGGKDESKRDVTGLVAALFTSVFFLEVSYSTEARFYQFFQLFFFLSLYWLYKSRSEQRYGWWACAALAVLLDTHLAGLVVVPVFLYAFYADKRDWIRHSPYLNG